MLDKKSILIVDDQESVIKSLKRLLLTEKYTILSSTDGASALKSAENHRDEIFLIISDQRMPNMTGTQFLEKSVQIIPDALRFILSGYADRDDVAKALNEGIAHRFLTKPWSSEELLIMINQAYHYPEKVRTLQDRRDAYADLPETGIMDREIRKFDEHRKDLFLGRIAVHHGFIKQSQLEESITALQSARQAGRHVSLENILFERGLISSDNMGKIVAVTRRRMARSFAKSAMRDFGIQKEEIERCMAIQAQEFSNTSTCRLLGDILVSEKLLTDEQKESIIIDQIYSERDMLSPGEEKSVSSAELKSQSTSETDRNGNISKDNSQIAGNELLLNRRKKSFFRQRALDKIFCKSAINRNIITEKEALSALEEQLIHFTRTFEIKHIKEIMVERTVISQSEAESISSAIMNPATSSTEPDRSTAKGSIEPGRDKQTDEIADRSSNKGELPSGIQSGSIGEKVVTIGSDDRFDILLSDDLTEATIVRKEKGEEDLSVDQLKEMLADKEIIYGLADYVAIEIFLRQSKSKPERLIIAKGKALKPGRNASIKYFFDNENDRFGKELASGKFDYRERGETPSVEKGALLAEKIPPIPAISGITVFGTEISPPDPSDINLDCGAGAELSNDGLKITAVTGGRPDISLGGKISVVPEKIVKGNVDFRTGNIKFGGDIVVTGNIIAGFSVTGSNLTVNEIDGAQINIANNLTVKNSINSSEIKAGGYVTAQIVKNCTIFTHGDVVIQKEIIDSTIVTSGKVVVPRGRVVSSKIHAAGGIVAMHIGSEVSSPCHLFLGSDEHSRDIMKSFLEKLEQQSKLMQKLETVERQYEQLSMKQLTDLSEISRLQEKLLLEKRKTLKDREKTESAIVKKQMDSFLADLEKRALKMDETINSLFDENDITQNKVREIKARIKSAKSELLYLENEKKGFEKWYEAKRSESEKEGVTISVMGNIFAGTIITGKECAMTVKSPIKNSLIKEVLNTENPVNLYHEMRIMPLGAAGRPHVYRN